MYGSCLQNFFLNVDVTTTHQITTAPTMKQAEEVLSPIRTAITRSRGPFYKFLTEGSLQNTTGSKANRMKLASTKNGIENFLTGSLLEIRPMRIDKLQGLQLKVATVDEWLSGDIREDVIGAIEQGASKVNDYLIVAISSEGTVRNGAGDTIKMELMDILKGDYINPHVSIWWYKLDSIDEVADPDKWLKANRTLERLFLMKPISWTLREQKRLRQLETIFWLSASDFLWRDIHITLHMKKLSHIAIEIIGRCHVLWELIYHKATISVHSHFYSHCRTDHSASKPETTFPHRL